MPKPKKPKTSLTAEDVKKLETLEIANIVRKLKAGRTLNKTERELIAKAPKHQPGNRIFDTMTNAAAALKIPMHIMRQAKARGCPAFRNSRVHETELLDWLTQHKDALAGPSHLPATLDGARTAKVLEEVERLRYRNRRERGELIERAWIAGALRGALGEMKRIATQIIEEDAGLTAAAGPSLPAQRQALERIIGRLFEAWNTLKHYFAEDPTNLHAND